MFHAIIKAKYKYEAISPPFTAKVRFSVKCILFD